MNNVLVPPTPAPRPRAQRLLGRLAVALLVLVAGYLSSLAPAAASHLKGGLLTAEITANGHLVGRFLYLDRYPDTVGNTSSESITITPPAGQTDGPQSITFTTTNVYSAPGTGVWEGFYDCDLAATFPAGQPDGEWFVEYQNSATVSSILNGNNNGNNNVNYLARVTKTGSTPSASPYIAGEAPLFIPIGYEYSANLLVTPQTGETFTYTEKTISSPDYTSQPWDTYTVVTCDAQGNLNIPQATTSTYTNGQNYQFYYRVSKANGDFSDIFVVMQATNNAPPTISGLTGAYSVAAAGSQTIPFTAADTNAGDTVTLVLRNAPAWVTLGANTPGNPAAANLVINPPTGTPPGTYTFTVRAADDGAGGLYADQIVVVTVTAEQTAENVDISQVVTPTTSTGGPGATVNGGSAIIPNTSAQAYTLSNIQLAFSDPTFIASATVSVTAGGVTRTVTVSPIAATTNFPISPALTIPANAQATMSVTVTLASLTAAAPITGGPSFTRMIPQIATDSSAATAVVAGLAFLALLGLGVQVTRKSSALRPQWAMLACAIVLSAGLYGCGGGGGGTSAGYPEQGSYKIASANRNINLTLVSVTATTPNLTVVTFNGLPASLGTVDLSL